MVSRRYVASMSIALVVSLGVVTVLLRQTGDSFFSWDLSWSSVLTGMVAGTVGGLWGALMYRLFEHVGWFGPKDN